MFAHGSMRSTYQANQDRAKYEGFLRKESEESKLRPENKFPVNHQPKPRSPLCGPLYHPKVNRIDELRKNLNELKSYEAKLLAEKDLSDSTKVNLNRVVTSKLNFPPHQAVFRDLPKIEITTSFPATTADNLIQQAAKITKEKNKKSQEVRDEVSELINKLVKLEYQNEEMNRKAETYALPNEDELLGFSKFKQPNFHMPNSKKETENFEKKIFEELHHSMFAHEDYLTSNRQFDPEREARFNDRVKECNCINSEDFYKRHSQCS